MDQRDRKEGVRAIQKLAYEDYGSQPQAIWSQHLVALRGGAGRILAKVEYNEEELRAYVHVAKDFYETVRHGFHSEVEKSGRPLPWSWRFVEEARRDVLHAAVHPCLRAAVVRVDSVPPLLKQAWLLLIPQTPLALETAHAAHLAGLPLMLNNSCHRHGARRSR